MIPSKRNLNLDGRIMQHLWLWMEKEILRYSFSFLSGDLRPRLYNTLLLETPKTLFSKKHSEYQAMNGRVIAFPTSSQEMIAFIFPR